MQIYLQKKYTTRIELREKDEETRSLKERAQDTYLAGHRQALNQKEKGMPEPHTSKGKQLKAKEKIKKNVHEFAYIEKKSYLCAQIVFIWLKQQNRIWIKRVERYRTRG